MLIQFKVKNYLSIKDEIIFSMEAACYDEHQENIITKDNNRYLKTTAMYGANASGKTNVFDAISKIGALLRMSNTLQPNMKLNITPFIFDDKTNEEPSEFEIIVSIKGIRYVYGFRADSYRIYDEYLYYYPNGRETEIFTRTNVNEYHFPREGKALELIKDKNTENKFFLATATTWNYEKTREVYDYLVNGIICINDYERLEITSFKRYKNDTTGKLKKFSIDILNKADINITDYEINDVTLDEKQYLALPPQIRQSIPIGIKGFNVRTSHKISNSEDKEIEKSIDFNMESIGTKNMFILTPLLYEVLEQGKTLVIDELDKSLHPFLVRFIVSLFNNDSLNKNGAQLIFNTHDTNMLDLEIFRRDQIWFVEKNPKTGSTDIYPLDDFSVRATDNIQKGYLNGRYGAIPFIIAGDVTWQEN